MKKTAEQLGITNVEDTLRREYRMEIDVRGDEAWFLCPVHDDTHPSASANLRTGLWHCFSCGAGGDAAHLGMRVLNITYDAVVDRVANPTALRKHEAHPTAQTMVLEHMPLPAPYDYDDGPLDELLDRGFSQRTLKRWDVRYVAAQTLDGKNGPYNIYASIGIPIYDQRGRLVAWCYRRTAESPEFQARYIYTAGAKIINSTWFGLNQNRKAKHVVVVEGALDAMWCDQAGFPAVALLGSHANAQKLALLDRYQSVTLLCDSDVAGAMATQRIGSALCEHMPVRVALYREGMGNDPQELTPIQLARVIREAVPWSQFVPGRRLALRWRQEYA